MDADSLLQVAYNLSDDATREQFLENSVAGLPFNAFNDPVQLYEAWLAICKRTGAIQKEFNVALKLIEATNYSRKFALGDSLVIHYASRVDEFESPRNKLEIYHAAAKTYLYAQEYDQTIKFDSLALQLLPMVEADFPQDSFAVDIYKFLSSAFVSNGSFHAATVTINNGIDLLKATDPDAKMLGDFYSQLGVLYSQIGLYDRAAEYFNRIASTNAGPGYQAMIQINLGRNHLLTKQYDQARKQYLSFFNYEIAPDERDHMLPFVYEGIIESYYRLGNVDSLDYYFAAFNDLLKEENTNNRESDFVYRQSRLFHELAHAQLSAAETTGKDLYQEAIDKNDPAERIMYTELLADLYRKKGDFKQADLYTRKLLSLQDSIQSANRNNALLLYYNQFETKEKENQILSLGLERERAEARRKQYQFAAGLLSVLLLTSLLFYLPLRKARRKLARQNVVLNELNATKDRFFGVIAHDLRNPIIALQSADRQVTTLYERGDTAGVKRTVGMISQTADQLTGVLDNLLQWALNQSGTITLRKQVLPLAITVNENFGLYAPAAQVRGVALINEVAANLTINADQNALQIILRNLIGNAIKYSPQDQAAVVKVTHRREGAMDLISVSDQGPGISPDAISRLFHLHRGEAPGGLRKSGTGLGLVLCREMAELHGGRIDVVSEVGVGTTFTVALPA